MKSLFKVLAIVAIFSTTHVFAQDATTFQVDKKWIIFHSIDGKKSVYLKTDAVSSITEDENRSEGPRLVITFSYKTLANFDYKTEDGVRVSFLGDINGFLLTYPDNDAGRQKREVEKKALLDKLNG